jgi:hypothetical protein
MKAMVAGKALGSDALLRQSALHLRLLQVAIATIAVVVGLKGRVLSGHVRCISITASLVLASYTIYAFVIAYYICWTTSQLTLLHVKALQCQCLSEG